jgi:adenylate cyclase
LAVFWTLVFVNYFNEQRQRHQIRSAFAQYLSPALVKRLADHPEQLKLGGETKELTILFSDVRNFTSIAESYKANPQGLTQLVNRLLTPLSNIVVENGGTIDKYMGDNVMAFWNAPLDDAAHASRACRAACGMLAAVTTLNGELRQAAEESGTPAIPIAVGIGINTGECVVGNMGSDIRFDYTVLGDSVNLAARLEGQTKAYGAPIIIGERTNLLVADQFYTVPIDIVRVKGKATPERIYALLVPIDNDFKDGGLKLDLEELLNAYRNREWSAVLRLLKRSKPELARYGIPNIETLYARRVRQFRRSPPPPSWDGVTDAVSK